MDKPFSKSRKPFTPRPAKAHGPRPHKPGHAGPPRNKPALELQTTTLWEYPSQHYGEGMQGDQSYIGATPSWVIWNLLERYTKPGDLVVDPMCGSGTTLDVARDLERRALGYDVAPTRPDIFRVDARKLPLENEKADFVFVDPPYSTHVDYSDSPQCIGKLDALEEGYYESMELAIREMHRVMKPGRYMALYVSDSWRNKKPFCPIGFRLFGIMCRYFEPVDIIAVVRHNKTLKRNHYHTEAVKGNYFLRGFNYLFIMRKALPERGPARNSKTGR
jgi:DNA modification methylase